MKLDNDILIELETLSPLLAAAPKTNVFSVPQGYFDLLDKVISIQVQPLVDSIDTADSLTVPADYFNNLPASILHKIKAQQDSNAAIPQLFSSASDKNVFEVPQGYFEQLPSTILDLIKDTDANEDHVVTASPLHNIPDTKIFTIPPAYFENLSALILDKIKMGLEENTDEDDLSNLLISSRNMNVFEVPQGYFDNVAAGIFDKINTPSVSQQDDVTTLSTSLKKLQSINVFEVPKGYFEQLSSTIINKLILKDSGAKEDIKVLSPVLAELQQTNIFAIPTGYFDTILPAVMQSVKPAPAKVVSMRTRSFFTKLAAAAIITGSMVIGIYKYTAKQPDNATTVASIGLPKITNTPTLDSTIAKGKDMNDQEFDAALNNLSKDDINNYLETNNSDEDMASLTAELDDNTLPDKNDYLLDEKTLENYLNKLKSQN